MDSKLILILFLFLLVGRSVPKTQIHGKEKRAGPNVPTWSYKIFQENQRILWIISYRPCQRNNTEWCRKDHGTCLLKQKLVLSSSQGNFPLWNEFQKYARANLVKARFEKSRSHYSRSLDHWELTTDNVPYGEVG